MYQRALRKAETDLAGMLCNQITDVSDIYYGGVRSVDTWDVNFHDTAALYVWAVRLYLLKDSMYFGEEMLYERIQMAYQYCLNWKHEDGTKDYIDCDFYTAAGSEVQNMAKTLHIIERAGQGDRKEKLYGQMKELMKALAEGLVNGGFHTPNQRWIYSGALAAAYSMIPDPRYLSKIEQYQAEGIDCDQDGEYAERSAGIYSYVTNEGLILMARYLGQPEYYEYVKRNLYMLRYYMEPDGSIFTMNSTRQDQGVKIWAEKYLSQYLYIAGIYGDKTLETTAARLYTNACDAGREVPLTLEFLLLNPQFMKYHPKRPGEKGEVLESYFEGAGILRRREGDISLTLIPGSKTFFFMQLGDISLFLRMSAHFFKVRNIIPDRLLKIEGGYRLFFAAEGNYMLPFREKQETADWWKMKHSERELIKKTRLEVELDIIPKRLGVELRLRTRTCANVPFRVEIGIMPECLVRGEGFLCKAQPGMWIIPTKGYVKAETVKNGIEIGPVFGEHGKVTGREGSAPRSNAHMTIYLNQFCTEAERVFHIKKFKMEGMTHEEEK